jgi:hypothetical protein
MWLPALGVALFAAGGVYWATSAPLKTVDESAGEQAVVATAAATASAAPPPSARPQPGNPGQHPPSGPSKQLPKGVLDLLKH